MEWLSQITIGEVTMAALTCLFLHDTLPAFLPDRIAGPGGWLINTSED